MPARAGSRGRRGRGRLTSKTQQRLAPEVAAERLQRLLRFLEQEVWPQVPPAVLGKKLTRREERRILD